MKVTAVAGLLNNFPRLKLLLLLSPLVGKRQLLSHKTVRGGPSTTHYLKSIKVRLSVNPFGKAIKEYSLLNTQLSLIT